MKKIFFYKFILLFSDPGFAYDCCSTTDLKTRQLQLSTFIEHILNDSFPFHSKPIQHNLNRTIARAYCTRSQDHLTHADETGRATMVDIGEKNVTTRTATAQAIVLVGMQILNLIEENNIKKGDVLTTAQLAGITAAKRTSDLIPLCHNIALSHVNVDMKLDRVHYAVVITSTARCEGRTGVEMEALTAASVAALTVYDMCKAVSHDIVISEVKLMSKTGGMRGDFKRKT